MPNNTEKLDLTPKDFSFICPLNMDELTPVEGGYHCDNCEKKVYDVSRMAKSEFQTLQEKTKDLCISFKKVTTVAVALSASSWVAADNNATQVPLIIKNSQEKKITYRHKGKPVPPQNKQNTFKLEKIKVIPHDNNGTNTTNALTLPMKCDIETSIDGGDNIAPKYNEEG